MKAPCALRRWYAFYWRGNELEHVFGALFVAGAVLIALRATGNLARQHDILGIIASIVATAVMFAWIAGGFFAGFVSFVYLIRLYADRKKAIAEFTAGMTEFGVYSSGLAPAVALLSAVKSCEEGRCDPEDAEKKMREIIEKLKKRVYVEVYESLKAQEEREDPCRKSIT